VSDSGVHSKPNVPKITCYISVLSAPFVLSNKSGSCELDRAVTGFRRPTTMG